MKNNLPYFFKDPHKLSSLPQGTPVLVGLSGGADSVALLHLLCSLRESSPFPLYAIHVNHGIRAEEYGNEALRDEQFCVELCRKLNIPLRVEHINVPSLATELHMSLETGAREGRYHCFINAMKELNAPILATAHNADDNLETQIFNLSRGCGIEGISGIAETRAIEDLPGGVVVRPILHATKAEILDFCQSNHISYQTDSTNLEDNCTRNVIRHRVIPELVKLFHSPQEAGLRLSSAAKEDDDCLTDEAVRYLNAHGNRLILKDLQVLHPAVFKRVIRLSFKGLTKASLEAVHLDAVSRLVHGSLCGYVSLPEKNYAVCDGKELSFLTEMPKESDPIPFSKKLDSPFTEVNELFAVSLEQANGSLPPLDHSNKPYSLFASAYIKGVKGEDLYAEMRRSGDKIRDGGVGKKVKKLLCDKRITLSLRDLLPMIKEGEEIVYIPACAVADRVKACEHDFEYLIRVYIKNQN